MKVKELEKKLREASEKLRGSRDKYAVDEQLLPGRGPGRFRFEFRAKKKKSKLFGAIANIARAAMYGPEEVAWTVAGEIAARRLGAYTEPIHKEMTGDELSALLARWAETIPKGFMETIGNAITLPEDERFLSAKVNPGKEIVITMDFVRLKGAGLEGEAGAEEGAGEQGGVAPQGPVSAPPVPLPARIPFQPALPSPSMGIDLSSLYVRGSLKNVGDGFEFVIRNPGGAVAITSPFKVIVDGRNFADVRILTSGGWRENSSIGSEAPLSVGPGEAVVFRVRGGRLEEGTHKIDVYASIAGNEVLISAVDEVR